MAQRLVTAGNFRPGVDTIEQIGATERHKGLYLELSEAFREPGDPEVLAPRALIKRVAPHAAFKENAAHIRTRLGDPGVQRAMGYADPVSPALVAHNMLNRAGLYEPVRRPLAHEGVLSETVNYAVLLERKAKRVRRAGEELIRVAESGVEVERLVAVSSGRSLSGNESDTLPDGTSSNRMMHEELDRLAGTGKFGAVELLHTDSKAGKDVAAVAARHIAGQGEIAALESMAVLMPAAAGNGQETGVQGWRALRAAVDERQVLGGVAEGRRFRFDSDPERPQLFIATDSIRLSSIEVEPSENVQDPIRGLSDGPRTLMYLGELASMLAA